MKKFFLYFLESFLLLLFVSCKVPSTIQTDCDYLRVLLTQGYAGYESAVLNNNFNVDKAIKKIKQTYKKQIFREKLHKIPQELQNDINVPAFQNAILSVLRKQLSIEDMHFTVSSDYFYDTLSSPYRLYNSQLFFEKKGDDFYLFREFLGNQASESQLENQTGNQSENKTEENSQNKNSTVNDSISENFKYTGDTANLFPTYVNTNYQKDKKQEESPELLYRFGVFSNKVLEQTEISIGNKNRKTKVSCETPFLPKNAWIGYAETKDTMYFSFSDLILAVDNPEEHEKAIQKLEDCKRKARKAKNKSYVILDLRSNLGGQTRFIQNLLTPIFYSDDWVNAEVFNQCIKQGDSGSASYETPITVASRLKYFLSKPGFSQEMISNQIAISKDMQENPRIYWAIQEDDTAQMNKLKVKLSESLYEKVHQITDNMEEKSENKITALPQAKNTQFAGKLIILLNSKTSSSAEQAIKQSFLANENQVILVGENSAGCIDFGETFQYELPNSKIKIALGTVDFRNQPGFTFNQKWHGDGKGFFPDYWCDSSTILSTLVGITKDQELWKILDGIDLEQK